VETPFGRRAEGVTLFERRHEKGTISRKKTPLIRGNGGKGSRWAGINKRHTFCRRPCFGVVQEQRKNEHPKIAMSLFMANKLGKYDCSHKNNTSQGTRRLKKRISGYPTSGTPQKASAWTRESVPP